MCFEGRYHIVFNGEIYNFNEVREELGPSVSEWQSRSDTEVILAAYARWGVACLSRFRGMFAFAIWDSHARVLFAARDRLGVKPLYYHHSSKALTYASRPHALFSLDPTLSRRIDEQALRIYLEAGHIPAPLSIFEDIRKLPPAHFMVLDEHGLKIQRYWDFRQIRPERSWLKRSEEDLLDELDELLTRSVRLRMIGDVPLGACLSGGIDSSLVIAKMCRYSEKPVSTFTIGFLDPRYDESSHALRVANHLGTAHISELLRVDDLLELMPTFLEQFDEPFFDYSAFPSMALYRLARKHVTVALTGDGGDELFGGYHYYRIVKGLAPFYSLPRWARGASAQLAAWSGTHESKLVAGALRP